MRPMEIEDREIEEFIKICEDEFGGRMTPKEARSVVAGLLALYERLARPLPFVETGGHSTDPSSDGS